jgi:hypothetical protein
MTNLKHISEDQLMTLAQQRRREALRGIEGCARDGTLLRIRLRRRRKSKTGIVADSVPDIPFSAGCLESQPWWR